MTCTRNKIANLYKPKGWTSFDTVCQVKKILGVKKAGHIGTLDPMAEGILPICLNGATRIIQFLSPLSKVYTATLELGISTDTQDATGKKIAAGDASRVTESDIRQVLADFTGPQAQIPPMYSAKKNKGIPLYKLARNGITIDRKPVSIVIHSIKFLKMEGNRVDFEVHCSAGTYVRTLCHDAGRKLGCEAHLLHLVRKQIGGFNLENALTLSELKAAHGDGSLPGKLFPLEKALDFLPEIRVKTKFVPTIANGGALSKSALETFPRGVRPGTHLRVLNGNDHLLAVVEAVVNPNPGAPAEPREIVFKPKRVLV